MSQVLGDIDLNLFRVFEAVYRLGSQTAAAAELRISQPAISSAVARLREQVGDRLFVRAGKGLAPTAMARSLAPSITAALGLLQASMAATRRFEPRTATRRFAIGVPDALEQALLPSVLRRLRTAAPRLELASVPCSPDEVSALLGSGDVDVALGVVRPHADDVVHRVLLRDHVGLAMRAGHPLAGGELTMAGWLAAAHLVVTGPSRGATEEELAIARLGLRRQVALRCQTYDAAAQLLATSDLVAVVPMYYGELLAARDAALALRPFPFPTPPLELALYWPRHAEAEPGSAWLRAELIAAVDEVQAARAPAAR